jgi:Holliday junction resolvase
LTVNYTVSGSATSGSDYQALAGNVLIPGGQTSVDIVVTPIDDAVIGEGDETVIVTLMADPAYAIEGQSSATVTIADNDTAPGTLLWATRGGGAGEDRAPQLALDGAGNSYITGLFQGTAIYGQGEANETTLVASGSDDIYVARYDTDGLLQWAKRAGGTGLDQGAAIAVDGLGNSYVTGRFQGTATFGPGEANQTTLVASGSDDIFVAQYDANGLLQWARRAGGSGSDQGINIGVDGFGKSYVTGGFSGTAIFGAGQANQTTLVASGGDDVFVAQYDANGLLQWARRAGGSGSDQGTGIGVDDLGNSYVTGFFNGTATFGPGQGNQTTLISAGNRDIFVARYDASGFLQWARRSGGTSADRGYTIAVDGSGNSYVTGLFRGTATFGPGQASQTAVISNGLDDIFIAKYDASGLLQWAKRAGGTGNDGGRSIAVDGSGNSYLAGWIEGAATFGLGEPNQTTLTSAGDRDIYVAQYDSNGAFQWVKQAGGLDTDQGTGIAADEFGVVYVTGYFADPAAAGATATFGPGESNQTILTSAGASDVFVAKFAGE